MKKNYLVALLVLITSFASAQIEPTTYRGAFAPAPTAMWTNSWTNFDPQNTVYPATTVTVSSEITTNTTWVAGSVYSLQGIIYVKNNATLTIQPGVVVKGAGAGAALVITKGAKLNAIGTATSPIVFTSNNAVGSRQKGDWGGIILLGKGSFNINNGVNNIEGITASADTQYGGGTTPDDNDNSGTLKYVRIEFGGYVYAPNQEINGLTFGAVGRGTTIDNVQVSFSNDDAFEWFGGAVNCKHLVSYRNLDDDFDTDNGFSGKVQFALAIRDPQISDAPAISTSEGFESDNNASGTAVSPYTNAVFTNCTLIGPSYRLTLPNGGTIATGFKRTARIRRASKLSIYNSIFMDFQEGLHIDGVAAENNAVAGDLAFKNNIQAGIVSKYIQVTSPGTITAGNNSAFNMTSWYAANGNTNLASNSGILTSPYNATDATIYSGLDYRPATGSPALGGSTFVGLVENIAPIATTPVVYCKGETAASLASSVALSGGVSLKWYTVATAGTASTTAPAITTTIVGSKTYYVSQVYSDGSESPRAAIVVKVNAVATTPGTITGTAAVGKYVATTTEFTYTIAAVTGATSYLWTAPTGVNIVSGQGTTSVIVNFNDVSAGAGTIGNLSVQAINAEGCKSTAKSLALTKALPKAPAAIKMTDALLPVPVTGILSAVTSFAKYMGTSTVLKLTATASVDATSYVWELPTGVNIVSGATTVQGVTTSSSNEIEVNFNDVTAENSLTSASTNVIRIGVSAKNGTGLSVVDNSALTTPSTSSIAKLLTLTATIPAAPSTIKLTDGSSTVAITDVSKFIGKTTEFTLTAAPSALASSYAWTLPDGVTQLSGGNTNVITVNFAGVASGVTVLPIGVKAVNGIGSSSTVNAAPYDASTAKILKITATVPSAATALVGDSTNLVCGATKSYSFTASAKALTYTITAPTGSVVTATDAPDNTTNSVITATNAFTVTYPSTFAITTATSTADKSLVIRASNGVGNNVTNLTKALTTAAFTGTIGAHTSSTTTTALAKFKTCQVKNIAIPEFTGASSYVWTVANGAVITDADQTTRTINVDFSAVTVTSTVITVKAINSCGVSSTVKTITLTKENCTSATNKTNENTISLVSNTEMYPNPATDVVNFNIDAISNGVIEMTIYSLDGKIVKESKGLSVENGTNSFTENVSNLNNGIYFVRITNSTSNEVITKRLIIKN